MSTYYRKFTDHDIEKFGNQFCRLEERYGVRAHGVTFELFMTVPEQNAHWIHIYFSNRALLANRRQGASVTLKAFLENGPRLVLSGALEMDGQQREALGEVAEQLLRRQQIAANVFDAMNMHAFQEDEDLRFERTHIISLRGDRYVEAFHGYHPPCRRKTGGKLHV